MQGISQREYARRHGVRHRAIQTAIQRGTIIPYVDGSIDVEQADRTWGIEHAARLAGPLAPDPAESAQRIDDMLAELDRNGADTTQPSPELLRLLGEI